MTTEESPEERVPFPAAEIVEGTELPDSRAEELLTQAHSSLFDHLSTLDSRQWEAIHAAILTVASQPISRVTVPQINDRLRAALGVSGPEGRGLAATLVTVIAAGSERDLGGALSRLSADERHELDFLQRSFQDWAGDIVRAQLDGLRDWLRVSVASVARRDVARESTRIGVDLELRDGTILAWEMPGLSSIRMLTSFIRQMGRLDREIFVEVSPSDLEAFEMEVSRLKLLLPGSGQAGDGAEDENSTQDAVS